MKFSSTDEVIDRANNTCYGLSGGIFTKNIDKAFKLANKIEAGMLFINSYGADTFGMPFGGIKDSGFGREQCVESIREYMEQKTVIIQTTED